MDVVLRLLFALLLEDGPQQIVSLESGSFFDRSPVQVAAEQLNRLRKVTPRKDEGGCRFHQDFGLVRLGRGGVADGIFHVVQALSPAIKES